MPFVVTQPLCRIHGPLFGVRFVAIEFFEALQQVAAGLGKVLEEFHKFAALCW